MARYRGSTFKKSRRYGFSILETGKEFKKGKMREYAPGQHGQGRRPKMSDYGIHLYEKQKAKFMYGLSEKQFKNTFLKAQKLKGIAGTNFLIRLESRLDNLVYRLGFATTRRQSRQLVNHGHFLVNGKKADIPSMDIKVGSIITVREKSKDLRPIVESMEKKQPAEWLTRNGFEGKYDRFPMRDELNKEINENLIVEYYSK